MSDIILEMRDITKEFPGVKALSNVNLGVERGEIHAICGENGAGKSTLMKVLSGVYPHGTYDGEIFFDGEEVKFNNINQSEAKGIVIIHQELALVPCRSPRTSSSATSSATRATSTGTRPTSALPSCSPESVWMRTPPHPSAISVSASSSWWRSPRRCPRR